MRSTEFINEAGSDRPAMTDAEWAARQAQGQKNLDALKGIGSKIAGAFKGNNQAATPAATQPGFLQDRDGNPVRDGSGQPILTPNSPVPAPAAPAAPAVPDAATAAPPEPAADVQIPQSQRTLVDPDTLNQTTPDVQNATPATQMPKRPGQQKSGPARVTQRPAASPNQSSAETARLARSGINPINATAAARIARQGAPGAAGYVKTTPPNIQNATPTPVDPTTLPVNQRISQAVAPGTSLVDRFRRSVGLPAGGTSPGVNESSDVDRIRHLAGLNKG